MEIDNFWHIQKTQFPASTRFGFGINSLFNTNKIMNKTEEQSWIKDKQVKQLCKY